jgi:hypothetical protein
MTDQPRVEALGEHCYLVRAHQGEDIVEIQVRATPGVIARLSSDETDETRIIEATAAYLIARQRADDLAPQLDLDDVAAAYAGFEDDLRQQFHHRDGPPDMNVTQWRTGVRRADDPPDPDDGHRVLVDRIWPRGLTLAAAAIDEWCPEGAPSDELRRWYGHDPGPVRSLPRPLPHQLDGPADAGPGPFAGAHRHQDHDAHRHR